MELRIYPTLMANLMQACQLIEEIPSVCQSCAADLCLRQQVLNLALGEEKEVLCLNCLAADNNKSAEQLLQSLSEYIVSRECFAKQWRRYASRDFCPDPQGCLPTVCFGKLSPVENETPTASLDLRGVACPVNFVKTRLRLDKMATGELLEVLLDDGEPIESVTSSVCSEGHLIESSTRIDAMGKGRDYHRLIIRKTMAA